MQSLISINSFTHLLISCTAQNGRLAFDTRNTVTVSCLTQTYRTENNTVLWNNLLW